MNFDECLGRLRDLMAATGNDTRCGCMQINTYGVNLVFKWGDCDPQCKMFNACMRCEQPAQYQMLGEDGDATGMLFY